MSIPAASRGCRRLSLEYFGGAPCVIVVLFLVLILACGTDILEVGLECSDTRRGFPSAKLPG